MLNILPEQFLYTSAARSIIVSGVMQEKQNYWKAKNRHACVSQPDFWTNNKERLSRRIIRPTFDAFESRKAPRSSGFRELLHKCWQAFFYQRRPSVLLVASLSPQTHSRRCAQHRQQQQHKGEGLWERRQTVHHIEAVIIGGKARRCIHARVLLLLASERQAATGARDGHAKATTAGLEILHWIT